MPQEHSTDKPSLEERVLASIDLIDAAQACTLLRIETEDPERAMQTMARDNAVITLAQKGRTMLPLFQFDLATGRVFDVVRDILKLRPTRISNLTLAYWMTRAHLDPAQRFGHEDGAILAACRRYIELERHG